MNAAKRTWVPIQIFENTEFGAKDVAVALGYSNGRDAVRKHVDGEDKTTVAICDTGSNYKTNAVFINESGLYSLIMGSKLESARRFKRSSVAFSDINIRYQLICALCGVCKQYSFVPIILMVLKHTPLGGGDKPKGAKARSSEELKFLSSQATLSYRVAVVKRSSPPEGAKGNRRFHTASALQKNQVNLSFSLAFRIFVKDSIYTYENTESVTLPPRTDNNDNQ